MQFVMLKEEHCMTCGSHTVSESCHSVHCNGQPFEERGFKCGRKIRWSPNFERQETVQECPKDPGEIERNRKIQNATAALLKTLGESQADTEWKDRVKRFLTQGY